MYNYYQIVKEHVTPSGLALPDESIVSCLKLEYKSDQLNKSLVRPLPNDVQHCQYNIRKRTCTRSNQYANYVSLKLIDNTCVLGMNISNKTSQQSNTLTTI
jgi:hypothetical protein